MNLAQSIIESASEAAESYVLTNVQVGFIYSTVMLDEKYMGVAYTFPRCGRCGVRDLGSEKPLCGRKASEMLSYLGQEDLLLSSLSLATVNALGAARALPENVQLGDVLDVMNIRERDRVCMVGCFLPLMKALDSMNVQLTAVDDIPKPGAKPPEEVESALPESDIALITGTSIINNTIDHLLDLASSCREIAILGPSTPMLPEAFLYTPVSCLSGIKILDPENAFRTIAEGGGFREFKKYAQKLNILVK
jgi:uncharacterized protein (DUF4213/DUF364 family)